MSTEPTRVIQVRIDPRLGEQLLSRRVHLQDLRHSNWTPEEAAAILLARAYATSRPSPARR